MSIQKRFLNLGNLWPGTAGYTPPFPALDYSTPAWGSYFNDQTVLDGTIPYFDVLGIPWLQSTANYGGFSASPAAHNAFAGDEHHMWANLFRILRKYGRDLTFASGYIYNTTNTNTGNALGGLASAVNDSYIIAEMLALGAPLPIVTMDGFPVLMAYQTTAPGNTTHVYTRAQWNAELVNYVSYLRSLWPTIRIGLDVNYASWGAFGQVGYLGPNGVAPNGNTTVGLYNYNFNYAALSDYQTVLYNPPPAPADGIVQALAAAGLGTFQYLQSDFPYDYMMGFASHGAWTNGYSVNWLKQLLLLASWTQGTAGLPYGLMLHSSIAGANGPNSRFYYEALDQLAQFEAAGGSPDQTVVEIFYPYPNAFLPTTQYDPFTYSSGSLARAVAAGDPTYTPAWLLFYSLGDPQYLTVDRMTQRNFFLGGQPNVAPLYSDQGILFYERGGEIDWSQEDGDSPLLRVTSGQGTIVSPNQAYIQSLIAAGWAPQSSRGFVSVPSAPPAPNDVLET